MKPIPVLFKILVRIPGPVGLWAGRIVKASHGLDEEADRCRKKRKDLIDIVRSRGLLIPFLLLSTLLSLGCQTTKELKAEGFKPTLIEKVELNYCDTVIAIDDAKDSVEDWEVGK